MNTGATTGLKVVIWCVGGLLCALAWSVGIWAPPATGNGSSEVGSRGQEPATADSPTFYKDVQPILRAHCEVCHRTGGIAPMALTTYEETKPYAQAIRAAAEKRSMPPWFAVAGIGRFANDPSLSDDEIKTLARWAAAGTPAGDVRNAQPGRAWAENWSIPAPDGVIKMSEPVKLPAEGEVEYTYEILPTGFTEDQWVQTAEVLPSARANVHHAVVYIRPPGSHWLEHAPVGRAFTASTLTEEADRRGAHWTDSDILLVYAPGSSPDEWPATMAKLVPAGSDLVFQMHYTTNGKKVEDQSSIGLMFAKQQPAQRVLTLQLTNDHFVIPPGADNFRVEARGTLPNDATLLSFFPHMHLRGKRFEYNLVKRGANGQPQEAQIETLLRVNYHFHWQMSYRLAEPRLLKAETELQAVAWYDNSAGNPHNPDPTAAVRWGDQTYDEMMIGFFDVAVAANLDKHGYFLRH